MSERKSNTARLKSQPKPILTPHEVQRIAEKLAVAVENDDEDLSLLTLLFDHLYETHEQGLDFWREMNRIKTVLFAHSTPFEHAQKEFERDIYKNRGKLLLWPYERKGAN